LCVKDKAELRYQGFSFVSSIAPDWEDPRTAGYDSHQMVKSRSFQHFQTKKLTMATFEDF
jgi:hypothetical protein